MTVPPFGQVGEVRLERRRVHRDEHVGPVAGRQDVVVGEVDLEAGDARERAGRRADLGGEVRERCEVVAERRGLAREPVARELHPVTRVAREADDDAVELLDPLGAAHGIRVRAADRRASTWYSVVKAAVPIRVGRPQAVAPRHVGSRRPSPHHR